MNPRIRLPLAVVLAGLAIVLGALYFRSTPSPVVQAPPAVQPTPLPVSPPPPPAATRPPAPLPEDPLLRQWVLSVKNRRREGVESSQAAFLSREGEYRAPLAKMAAEDEDPRVRAFSVAVLGRMKSPPPEAFFMERLGDPSEHPRTSALHALEKLGTAACLSKVDGLASSDPVPGVRAAAAQTAKAVRSR